MKIKKIFLSFVLMLSMLCAVACKDKKETAPETPAPEPTPPPAVTKTDPTVSVSVEDRLYFVGESLSDIELVVASGSTSGTVVWADDDYVLVQGENTCEWSFTPTDSDSYNSKTGTVSITAIKLETPQVVVNVVEGQTIYIDARYSTIELEATASFGGAAVEGTISWVTPNALLVEGENVCEWKFTPTKSTTYAVVTGTVTLNATVQQTPTGISVIENTKPQYVAFDTIDKDALTVCIVYDGGKAEEISDIENVEIIYNTGESLRRGDTKVTVNYEAFTTELKGLTVGYKEIEEPVFTETVVYSGNEKLLTLPSSANSRYYEFEPLLEINAGKYDLVVTLKDSDNFKWVNGDEPSITVVCEILKADLVEDETNFVGEYNGQEHFASVTNQTENDIYYSDSELNSDNYGSASLEPIKKINAGTYTVYYYMEGDSNHNGKAGTLTVEISKQTPIMSLEYCYSLKTGYAINYPTEYVSIVDKQSNVVSADDLQITYYILYLGNNSSGNIKTNSSNSGAETEGGAPKNDSVNNYYAVVKYAGSQNYNEVTAYTTLFIDGANLQFYAKSGEDKFAFKYASDGFYAASNEINDVDVSVSGSSSECNAYLEFEELAVDENGLKIVKFDSKFGEGAESIKTGRLVFADGKYQLFSTDGNLYPFGYDANNEELTVEDGVINEVTLIKWEIPKYLKSFVAETVTEEQFNAEKNTSRYTEIEFYNDYGTIRFNAKVNLPYAGGYVSSGGYEEWSGVAEIEFVRPYGAPISYGLQCYIINKGTLESSGYEKQKHGFRLSWYYSVGQSHEPTTVSIYGQPTGSSLLSSSPYSALIDVVFTAS